MTDAGSTLTAAGVFAGTDVDDLVVLTLLFLSARTSGRPSPWQIWAGQITGIILLIAVSAAAALGLTAVPDRWAGLFGLVPFGLGVVGLTRAIRSWGEDEPPETVTATGLLSVAALTIANGADNISVYTPLFRAIGVGGTLVTASVFLAGVVVWCLAATWLSSHKVVLGLVEQYGHWIVPVVFIVIGVIIVIESGVLLELTGR